MSTQTRQVRLAEAGELLRRLIQERGLKLSELARSCRVDRCHLWRVLQGKVEPKLSTLGRLIAILRPGATDLARLVALYLMSSQEETPA